MKIVPPPPSARGVATGFAAGEPGQGAQPELAALAVRDALAKAGSNYAHAVILLLSAEFSRHAQAAVTAAGRAARCLQVAGCTAPGVFTEHSWAQHQPAAAALVLCGDITLGPVRAEGNSLTFLQPDCASADWLTPYPPRFGVLAGGAGPHDAGKVWGQGKVRGDGRFEASFHGASVRTALSRGLRLLSPTLLVADQDNFDLFQMSRGAALDTLLHALPPEVATPDSLPLQRLCALVLDPGMQAPAALAEGRYTLIPLLAINPRERSVTLAAPLAEGSALIWAWREPGAAEADSRDAIAQLSNGKQDEPDFALVFSCISRGPYFYQDHDRDLAQLTARYPGLPVLGAYGAGEIMALGDGNTLLAYSTVFSLVSAHV